ncbi:hypothetical protein AA13595_0890 [Gluconacetobacter johannae DSM 13595]|uniref:Uncharacterized protein n=1 Tax=Gluconacetobacter johannae TaxID=112140 RepID=A0A7W4J9E0_9PROT|nr:hypothetical protein [Gluconacetobacter johannae]MBB2177021.1 hypothetical protein [Gluconacetobacter johannae]GBQ82313.1 hypothetical protein AA13595_0890 [Gluconacetobacter johannae DSM 13595]
MTHSQQHKADMASAPSDGDGLESLGDFLRRTMNREHLQNAMRVHLKAGGFCGCFTDVGGVLIWDGVTA